MNDDRRTYLGGPGAATILGVNPFETPLALWQKLTKRAEPTEVNDAMRSGMRLERAVLDYAAEELGQPVIDGPFLKHPTLPLGGHLDGVTESGDVVEAKTSRSKRDWGEPGTAEVPLSYAAQCQHYLGLMPSAPVAWIPVLFSGLDFALYKVERDDATIEAMQQICSDWWQTHVVGDVPPPPVNGADAALLFPKDTGAVAIADDVIVETIDKLRSAKDQIAELSELRDQLESRLKLHMGAASQLALPSGVIAATWKTTRPARRFDASALKAALPQIYEQYCTESTSRRFLLK